MATEWPDDLTEEQAASAEEFIQVAIFGRRVSIGLQAGEMAFDMFPPEWKRSLALGNTVLTILAAAMRYPEWAQGWLNAAGTLSLPTTEETMRMIVESLPVEVAAP